MCGIVSSRKPVDVVVQVREMGWSGRTLLRNAVYSAHFSTEGLSHAGARYKLAAVREVAARYGAEVANSIPVFIHAAPFMEFTPILGPPGARRQPTSALLPVARVFPHPARL